MKMMRNDINDAFCVLMENDDDKKLQVEIFSVVCEGFYIFGFDVNNDYSSLCRISAKILLLKSHRSPCAAAGLESLTFT